MLLIIRLIIVMTEVVKPSKFHYQTTIPACKTWPSLEPAWSRACASGAKNNFTTWRSLSAEAARKVGSQLSADRYMPVKQYQVIFLVAATKCYFAISSSITPSRLQCSVTMATPPLKIKLYFVFAYTWYVPMMMWLVFRTLSSQRPQNVWCTVCLDWVQVQFLTRPTSTTPLLWLEAAGKNMQFLEEYLIWILLWSWLVTHQLTSPDNNCRSVTSSWGRKGRKEHNYADLQENIWLPSFCGLHKRQTTQSKGFWHAYDFNQWGAPTCHKDLDSLFKWRELIKLGSLGCIMSSHKLKLSHLTKAEYSTSRDDTSAAWF